MGVEDDDEREEPVEDGPEEPEGDSAGDTDVPPHSLVDTPVEDPAAPSTQPARSSSPDFAERPSTAPRGSKPPEEEDEGRRRQRRKLEGLLRESFRRAVEKGVEAGIGAIGSGVDALEKGVEASRDTMKTVRGVVEEAKLPKEAANYLFGQIDETKNVLIRAVSREVRDFLANTDIAHELQRALTSLSFEIRTEIRFVPNEKGVMKPEVKSRAVPHRARGEDEGER